MPSACGEWKAFYRSFIDSARENVRSFEGDAALIEIAASENRAACLFIARNYRQAAEEIQRILNRPRLTDREKGWFLQLGATYLYPLDKSKAMSMQKRAHELNQFLFIPPAGITYHRMADQARGQGALALQYFLEHKNVNEFVVKANAVCDRLSFGVEAELFEQALEDIAKTIGIPSERPEKLYGKGPDCLWQLNSAQFLIIEAKSEVRLDRPVIYKSEAEQVLHSCEWFKQEYPGKQGLPLLFHVATDLDSAAVFPPDARIATPDILNKFVASARAFVAAIAAEDRGHLTERRVNDLLKQNCLTSEQCLSESKKVRPTRPLVRPAKRGS